MLYVIVLIAFLLGLLVIMIRRNEGKNKTGNDLIGYKVTVYCPLSNYRCTCAVSTPDYIEILCQAPRNVKPGEVLTIVSYEDGVYYLQ